MTDPAHVHARARQVAETWRRFSAAPPWARLLLLVVLIVPLLVLAMVAFIVGAVVIAVLALVRPLLGRIRGVLPRRDGRENVVVRRNG